MDYNRVEVFICGNKFSFRTSESPQYILELAGKLESLVKEVFGNGNFMNFTSAVVISALELIDENATISSNMDNIRTQIKSYIEEAASSRLEAAELSRELAEARRKIEQMETDMQLLRLQNDIEKKK